MSLEKIIKEAIDKNPMEMKDAFAEEMQTRVALALEEKYKKATEAKDSDEDDDDEDDDDEDEDDDEDDVKEGKLPPALQAAIDKKNGKKKKDDDDEDEDDVNEAADTHHTVDIDHMGGADVHARRYGITLKKTKGTDYSYDASGKKENLKKYLVHHYNNDHNDAKEQHPEVFKN